MVNIILSPNELALAHFEGERRHLVHLRRGDPMVNDTERSLLKDLTGASGELAVCKYLNLAWTGVEGPHRRDCGGLVEVRATDLSHGRLWGYEKDPDTVPSVFAVQETPALFELRGWLWGREVKREEHREGPNLFYVPRGVPLRPMKLLLLWVNDQRRIAEDHAA
jgi:hypothetical protein